MTMEPESNGFAPQGAWSRLYVPAAVLALLVLANSLASRMDFNPLTAAQNSRLTMDGAAETKPAAGFSIIGTLFPADSPYRVLTSSIPTNSPRRLSVLFLGNSQTIATMDKQPGDVLAPVRLWELLNRGTEESQGPVALRIGSEPNLRMAEMLLKTVLAASDSERRIDVVIASIVLDGLRWVDPRENVADVARDPKVHGELMDLVRSTRDLPAAQSVLQGMVGGDVQDVGRTGGSRGAEAPLSKARPAEEAETWLQDRMERALPLFRERGKIYGETLVHYVAIRNRALGVRTSTRRPIPDGMYSTNLELIEAMLRYLKERRVHCTIYFAPIRPIEPNPYDPRDIARFGRDLPALCRRYDALYFDYSGLIPEEMWTNYPETYADVGGERDYAHFTGRAHRHLAARLEQDLRPSFDVWLAEKSAHTGPTATLRREVTPAR